MQFEALSKVFNQSDVNYSNKTSKKVFFKLFTLTFIRANKAKQPSTLGCVCAQHQNFYLGKLHIFLVFVKQSVLNKNTQTTNSGNHNHTSIEMQNDCKPISFKKCLCGCYWQSGFYNTVFHYKN